MLKKLIFISFCFLNITINAQNFNISNERTYSWLYNQHIDTLENFHTSMRPFSRNEVDDYDTLIKSYNIVTKSNFIENLCNTNSSDAGKSFISIEPLINTGFTLEKNDVDQQSLIETSIGARIQSKIGKKWSTQLMFLADFSDYPSHIEAVEIRKNITPGYGYTDGGTSYFGRGNVTFTADKHFTFQLGYGTNFIGDGYRSLFLSDNSYSYPYLKISANIWRLKYMALYTNYQDIRGSNGVINNYFHKFSSVHYLSYNATKWLNFGFFESIIWQAQQDQFYRGFDVSYLNPVIFLRPTEYAQGSPDNALLGGSFKVRIKKKNIFYSQVILDEFLLEEVKAGNGWWANKYGFQFGVKSYDFMWIKNLKMQLEYNMVRPFTYTHNYNPSNVSTLQNYAHFNSPLAHPLGANFNEVMASLTYQKKRWIFEGISTIARVGLDSSSNSNVGQDIYKPNNDRLGDYGYFTGGGITTDILNSTLKISYVINPASNLIISAGVTNRMYKNDYVDSSNNMIFIGLKTAIINRYTDF